MSIREAEIYLKNKLQRIYDLQESRAIARWLMHSLCGGDYFMRYDDELREDSLKRLSAAIPRLLAGEPVQYIVGETEFYGLKLKITPAALIPRPETEELVDKIRKSIDISDPLIFDIGTGSGAIAIALKSIFPPARIYASDISHEALALARENASKLHLAVKFIHHDILKDSWPKIPTMDVIVSNPPYIAWSEWSSLPAIVRKYEPPIALFVKDQDPLLYYRVIAKKAKDRLRPGGMIFFEIHEAYGSELIRLLKETGYDEVALYQDLQGKARIIKATLIKCPLQK